MSDRQWISNPAVAGSSPAGRTFSTPHPICQKAIGERDLAPISSAIPRVRRQIGRAEIAPARGPSFVPPRVPRGVPRFASLATASVLAGCDVPLGEKIWSSYQWSIAAPIGLALAVLTLVGVAFAVWLGCDLIERLMGYGPHRKSRGGGDE